MIRPAPLLTIAPSYSILSIEAGGAGAQPPCGYLSQARWACLYARWLFLRANFGELRVCELRRTPCMRTSENSVNAKFALFHRPSPDRVLCKQGHEPVISKKPRPAQAHRRKMSCAWGHFMQDREC